MSGQEPLKNMVHWCRSGLKPWPFLGRKWATTTKYDHPVDRELWAEGKMEMDGETEGRKMGDNKKRGSFSGTDVSTEALHRWSEFFLRPCDRHRHKEVSWRLEHQLCCTKKVLNIFSSWVKMVCVNRINRQREKQKKRHTSIAALLSPRPLL